MTKNDPWNGSNVRRARGAMTIWLTNSGGMPCGKCGRQVLVSDKWVVGHKKSRHAFPELMLDAVNWQPEHQACSDRSGHDARMERADRVAREAVSRNQLLTPDPQTTALADLLASWPGLTWHELTPVPADEWETYLADEAHWLASGGHASDRPRLRRVVLVVGPPGAGKTTTAKWVADQNWMMLFDRDDTQWRSESDFLAATAGLRYEPHAWAVVIRTAATQEDRDKWADFLAATDLLVVDPGQAETTRRIRARGRNVRGLVTAANEWYERAGQTLL